MGSSNRADLSLPASVLAFNEELKAFDEKTNPNRTMRTCRHGRHVRPRTGTSLTCGFSDDWYELILSEPPLSITRSE
jgi:hypothetical protein